MTSADVYAPGVYVAPGWDVQGRKLADKFGLPLRRSYIVGMGMAEVIANPGGESRLIPLLS